MRRISLAAAVTQLANARSLRDWLRHCSIAGAALIRYIKVELHLHIIIRESFFYIVYDMFIHYFHVR